MIELLTKYYNYSEEEAMDFLEYQSSNNGEVLHEFFDNIDNGGEPEPLQAVERT